MKRQDLIFQEMEREKIFILDVHSRGYFQMESPKLFIERFTEAFNYATVTHYLKGDFIDFEPEEGNKKYSERLKLIRELKNNGISVEGRPLFWTHTWVTPDWLKKKSYSELLKYVEKHVREVVSFYKDEIEVWEVVNEMHDWATEVQLNHEQTFELTKLACNVARDANPKIRLLINNCCPLLISASSCTASGNGRRHHERRCREVAVRPAAAPDPRRSMPWHPIS